MGVTKGVRLQAFGPAEGRADVGLRTYHHIVILGLAPQMQVVGGPAKLHGPVAIGKSHRPVREDLELENVRADVGIGQLVYFRPDFRAGPGKGARQRQAGSQHCAREGCGQGGEAHEQGEAGLDL